MGTVYLIHFDKPYRHARHYLGYTDDLDARLAAHANSNGARLMEVIVEAGITWQLARTVYCTSPCTGVVQGSPLQCLGGRASA